MNKTVIVNAWHVNIFMYTQLLGAEKTDICFYTSHGGEHKNTANILETAVFTIICEFKKKEKGKKLSTKAVEPWESIL